MPDYTQIPTNVPTVDLTTELLADGMTTEFPIRINRALQKFMDQAAAINGVGAALNILTTELNNNDVVQGRARNFLSFETVVGLQASGAPPNAGTSAAEPALVWRDTDEKNGYYGWTGTLWIKHAEMFRGPKGERGEDGVGLPGDRGERGPRGYQGEIGPTGLTPDGFAQDPLTKAQFDARDFGTGVGEGDANADTAAMKALVDYLGGADSAANLGGRPGSTVLIPGHLVLNETITHFRTSVVYEGRGWTHTPGSNWDGSYSKPKGTSFKWDGPEGLPMFDFDDCRYFGFKNLAIIGNSVRPPIGIMVDTRNPGHGGNAHMLLRDVKIGLEDWLPAVGGTPDHGRMLSGIVCRAVHFGNVDYQEWDNVEISGCEDIAIDFQHAQHVYGRFGRIHVQKSRVGIRTNSRQHFERLAFSDVDEPLLCGGDWIPHPSDVGNVNLLAQSGTPQPHVTVGFYEAERVARLFAAEGSARVYIMGGHAQLPLVRAGVGTPWKPGVTLAAGDRVQRGDPTSTTPDAVYVWEANSSFTTSTRFNAAERANFTRLQTLQQMIGTYWRTCADPTRPHTRTGVNGNPFTGQSMVDHGAAKNGAVVSFSNFHFNDGAYTGNNERAKILMRAQSSGSLDARPPRITLNNCTGVVPELFEDGLEFADDHRIVEADLEDGRRFRNWLNQGQLGLKLTGSSANMREHLDFDRYDTGASKFVLNRTTSTPVVVEVDSSGVITATDISVTPVRDYTTGDRTGFMQVVSSAGNYSTSTPQNLVNGDSALTAAGSWALGAGVAAAGSFIAFILENPAELSSITIDKSPIANFGIARVLVADEWTTEADWTGNVTARTVASADSSFDGTSNTWTLTHGAAKKVYVLEGVTGSWTTAPWLTEMTAVQV